VSFLALDGRVNGVITQWRSADDVVALQLSPRYQDTMARVLSEGLLEAMAPVALWPIPTDVARWSRALALRVHRAMENLPATF
jgi:predicted N-acetyltransferase YhbS